MTTFRRPINTVAQYALMFEITDIVRSMPNVPNVWLEVVDEITDLALGHSSAPSRLTFNHGDRLTMLQKQLLSDLSRVINDDRFYEIAYRVEPNFWASVVSDDLPIVEELAFSVPSRPSVYEIWADDYKSERDDARREAMAEFWGGYKDGRWEAEHNGESFLDEVGEVEDPLAVLAEG